MNFNELIINLENVDVNDICDSWSWLLPGMERVLLVTRMGDIFLLGNDDGVYWLATDTGTLTKIADNINEFKQALTVSDNIENWFFPGLIEELKLSEKYLKDNQVYGFKQLPVLGGQYEVENIEPTDISVHFSITGQICEKINNLPDGTGVTIKIVE